MGYSVKWINENLGVTRDMLRYYEKEKLLLKDDTRNQENNYRDYSDDDIERIWAIKLLISIGFSAKEIYSLMNDPDYDFDSAIAKKVSELERKHDENLIYLNFAKSIKFSGCVPTVSKVGTMRFDDFIEYARKNWNFYDDPRMSSFMQYSDTLISMQSKEFDVEELKQILELFEKTNIQDMMNLYVLHGYFQVIADMREDDFSSDTVQRVVRLLHEYMLSNNTVPELDGKISPQFVARLGRSFLGGDSSILHEQNYGKEGCLFIANALAYYAGLSIEDL